MMLEQRLARATTDAHRPLEFQWAEVVKVEQEIPEVATLGLRFTDPAVRDAYLFEPGQFNMLYVPGYGEAAISISSDAEDRAVISHTVRFVGNVTRALSRLRAGDQLGVRGPFGSSWPVGELEGKDVFIACGGIGLPPLRPALHHLMRHRKKNGKVPLLNGGRT